MQLFTRFAADGELTGQFGSATVKVFIISEQPHHVKVGRL